MSVGRPSLSGSVRSEQSDVYIAFLEFGERLSQTRCFSYNEAGIYCRKEHFSYQRGIVRIIFDNKHPGRIVSCREAACLICFCTQVHANSRPAAVP